MARTTAKQRERMKAYYEKNREQILAQKKAYRDTDEYREYRRKWYANNKDSSRNTKLKRHFGITLEEYREMEAQQEECCAICGLHKSKNTLVASGETMDLAVDHCHETGKVRGLLCTNCNNGLGRFFDKPDILRKAADYLEK